MPPCKEKNKLNEFEGAMSCSQTAISLVFMKTLTSGSLILLKNVVFLFLFNLSMISKVPLNMLIWGAFLTPEQQKYIALCDLEGRQFILFL